MLLEQRFRVPPLVRLNGKAPIDHAWSTGPRREAQCWRKRLVGYEGNLGLLTGEGLVVVDVDLYKPGAEDSLAELHALGLPHETITCLTGGGGRHFYYWCALPVQSGELVGFPGIDIKAQGGQVAVPPSVHPDTGIAYEWEFGWGPTDLEPAPLPVAIYELLTTGRRPGAATELDERDEAAVNLLLEHFGGHHPAQRLGYVEVTRPGKESGASATVGAVGRGVTKVWSTHWEGLAAGVYGLTELRRLAGVERPRFRIPETEGLELPDGYRLWRPGDEELDRLELGENAYHGVVGDFLLHLAGRTEAHPAAIGASVLAHFGVHLGRKVSYIAGPIVQYPSLWFGVIGPSSSGGKGVADEAAQLLLGAVDPLLARRHALSGFGSGEALVDAMRDDEAREKRRLVHEHELALVLRVCQREGSTLSEHLRNAFDGKPLENRTRSKGEAIATGYSLGVLGSITIEELLELLDEVSIFNGLANRFLWLWSELTTTLPYGAVIDDVLLHAWGLRIRERLEQSRRYPILRGTPAGDVWESFYMERRRGVGDDPRLQAVTARHHVHAARLMTVFAALDDADELGPDHVRAAIAWCDYSVATVEHAFALGATGKSGVLLKAIRGAGADGLSGTAQRDLFHRHLTGEQLEALRADLERRHLVHTFQRPTAGRSTTVSVAIHPWGAAT
jgi:hypothetical protein